MAEFEAIIAGDGFGLVGESKFVEHGVHEITGTVAGEGASGAVSTMGARRESKDEDACAWISEARNRPGPVTLVLIGSATGLCQATTVVSEARTTFAGDDVVANLLK